MFIMIHVDYLQQLDCKLISQLVNEQTPILIRTSQALYHRQRQPWGNHRRGSWFASWNSRQHLMLCTSRVRGVTIVALHLPFLFDIFAPFERWKTWFIEISSVSRDWYRLKHFWPILYPQNRLLGASLAVGHCSLKENPNYLPTKNYTATLLKARRIFR